MLRITCKLLSVSQKWNLFSTQLQSFLADGTTEGQPTKSLQAARNFLRDAEINRVVAEPDDALEFVYYMHRVQYPKNSKLEEAAKEWLQQNSNRFTAKHLGSLCQYAMERQCSSVELWYRLVLRSEWFRERLPLLLPAMTLEEVVALMRVVCNGAQQYNTRHVLSSSGNIAAVKDAGSVSDDTLHALSAQVLQQCRLLLQKMSTPLAAGGFKLRDPTTSLRSALLNDIIVLVVPIDMHGDELIRLLEPHIASLSLEETVQLATSVVTDFNGSSPAKASIIAFAVSGAIQHCRGTTAGALDDCIALLKLVNKHILEQTAARADAPLLQHLDKVALDLTMAILQHESPVAQRGETILEIAKAVASNHSLHRNARLCARITPKCAEASSDAFEQASLELCVNVYLENDSKAVDALQKCLRESRNATSLQTSARYFFNGIGLALQRFERCASLGIDIRSSPSLVAGTPSAEGGALEEVLEATHKAKEVMLQQRLFLTVGDAASLLFVLAMLSSLGAQHQLAPSNGPLLTMEDVDMLVQRIVHSSKFVRGQNFSASQFSAGVMMNITMALAALRYDARRQPSLVDLLNECDVTKLVDEDLHSTTTILVALNEINLQNEPLCKKIVQQMLNLSHTSPTTDVVRTLVAISVLNIRDVHVVSTMLRELERRSDIATLHVVQAADASRRLRMTSQFQASKLSARLVDLTVRAGPNSPKGTISLDHFSVLIGACSSEEQRRLVELLGQTADNNGVTVHKKFAATLREYLQSQPSVALLLLSSKECPAEYLRIIHTFLTDPKTAPLKTDAIEAEVFAIAVRTLDAMATERTKSGQCAIDIEATFAALCTFCSGFAPHLSESDMAVVVEAALKLDKVPNAVFRTIGRRIATLASGSTPDNALRFLTLYGKHKVRDDRVVKSLLSRCVETVGVIASSAEMSSKLRKACEMYPYWSQGALTAMQRQTQMKARRERRLEN